MKLSPSSLLADAKACVTRMPLQVVLLCALTAYAVLQLLENSTTVVWLNVFLPNALLFTVAAGIRFGTGRHKKLLSVMLVASLVIALADGIWVQNCKGLVTSSMIAVHIAVWTSTAAAIIFVPSPRGDNDELPSWSFAVRQIVSALFCGCIAWIMATAIFFIYATIQLLFDCELPWDLFLSLQIVFAGAMPAFIFLCMIPFGSRRFRHKSTDGNLTTKVALYLVVPVAAVYMLILYAYGAKILLSWSLPVGMVTYPVAGLFLAVMLAEFMLYPASRREHNRFIDIVVRLLPALMLPLLVLMSVGLCRRLHDYGVTAMRVYGVIFNLWTYAVCIGLWLRGNRRFVWIPALFAILFLASSVIPYFNVSEICGRARLSQARSIVKKYVPDAEFPMPSEQFFDIRDSMRPEDSESITDILYYIRWNNGENALQEIVSKPYDIYDLTIYNTVVVEEVVVEEDSVEVLPDTVVYDDTFAQE